jgi:hypothetical protein
MEEPLGSGSQSQPRQKRENQNWLVVEAEEVALAVIVAEE